MNKVDGFDNLLFFFFKNWGRGFLHDNKIYLKSFIKAFLSATYYIRPDQEVTNDCHICTATQIQFECDQCQGPDKQSKILALFILPVH